MCKADDIIGGIIVATTAFIMAGAVFIMASTIYDDYKRNKKK
jgi:hypothetical protein